MTRSKFFLFVILLMLMLCQSDGLCQYANVASMLAKIYKNTNQRFTIEMEYPSVEDRKSGPYILLNQKVPTHLQSRIKDPNILELICNSIERKFVVLPSEYLGITHIIEDSLFNNPKNPMEQKIAEIDFNGSTPELIDELSKSIPGISAVRLTDRVYKIPFYRYRHAKIKAENITLRDLLTRAIEEIHPPDFPRIWDSKVMLTKGRTLINYW